MSKRNLAKQQIIFLRRKLGSREKVAEAIGVSPGSVYNWENGTKPHKRHRAAILNAMGAGPKHQILRALRELVRMVEEL